MNDLQQGVDRASGQDWTGLFIFEVEKMARAFEQVGRAIAETLMPAMNAIAAWWQTAAADLFWLLPSDEQEKAARRYARAYNWKHAGRRVSWRRLSRPQRAAAYAAWKAAQ